MNNPKRLLLILLVLMLSAAVLAGCAGGEDNKPSSQEQRYIDSIRNATLSGQGYNVPIGDAFDDFFYEPYWEYDSSQDAVLALGEAIWDGEDAYFCLVFEFTDRAREHFKLTTIAVNILRTDETIYLRGADFNDVLEAVFGG